MHTDIGVFNYNTQEIWIIKDFEYKEDLENELQGYLHSKHGLVSKYYDWMEITSTEPEVIYFDRTINTK
jgi:hypothetical protein